jgi:lysine 2,3-aminomutase
MVLKTLMQQLLKLRIRPYYLYQCDPVQGTSHFRTSVRTGLAIIEQLRGHMTGYGVPQYVIDAPGGGGKVPLSPDYVVYQDAHKLVLRNYEGKRFTYYDDAAEATATTPVTASSAASTTAGATQPRLCNPPHRSSL